MRRVHWGRAIGGAAIAEASVIAAAIAWVAVYSYAINPGQPVSAYQAHAQASSPWVSILVGVPVFYLISRYIARAVPTAIALFVIVLVVDAVILVASTPLTEIPAGLVLLSYTTKLAASYFGGLQAERQAKVASERRKIAT